MSILSGRGGTLCVRSVAIAKDLSHGLPTLGVEKPRPSAIPATNELMQSDRTELDQIQVRVGLSIEPTINNLI